MRIRLPFAFAFLALLLLSSSAGLLPHSALPSAPSSAQPYIPTHSDKALHFLSFLLLTFTFYFILDTTRRRATNLTLIFVTVLLGVGSEVAQGLLPNDREFDPWDVLGNVLGSAVGLGACGWYHRRMIERRRRAKYSALTGEGIEEDDLELGEGPGASGGLEEGQETGLVSVDTHTRSKAKSVEEELDNWDENAPDEWDADEDDTTTNTGDAKMTPATSSADSSEEPRKKLAVD